MNSWIAIQDTITYIEQHYEEKIEVEQLAQLAHLSKYYYQRLFYRLTGKTVIEYVRLRRLAHGAEKLKKKKDKIVEIAFACGFSSHSNFSRAFKETYGLTPEEYRKGEVVLDHFIKPDLSLQYVVVDSNVPLIVEGMVLEIMPKSLKEDVMFVGKSKIASVAQLAEPKINSLIELWKEVETKNQIAVDILTQTEDPTKFDYFVGLEGTAILRNQEVRIMPKGDYVVCRYEAENFEMLVQEALYKASRYLYDTWLPRHEMKPDAFLVQKYFYPFEENCYIELWAKLA